MLFTPGPTEIEKEIRELASTPLPYFRGQEYCDVILEITESLKYLFQTRNTPLIITSSGTGVMEMAILNLLDAGDSVIVVNCGTFGQKWTAMCRAFDVNVREITPDLGKLPDLDEINDAITDDTRAVLVTAHETSTGLLNDIEGIGRITDAKNILLIVDGVSSIGADHFRMDEWRCDCAMVSSQKALACMPGLSFIAFSSKAWETIPGIKRNRCYFDAEEYMNNIGRGMVPYTPAMNVSFQIKKRLDMIRETGLDHYIRHHHTRANAFRKKILSFGDFSLFAERQSNSLTSIKLPDHCSMSGVVSYIREKYDWYIAPNPTHDESYLRISHMGDISIENLLLLADRIKEACLFIRNKGV
jgi:aspartate aminotransferase-like enzyme